MMLAFIFDSVGFGEWFVLLTVVLIFVGPQKLPGVAKTIGNYYARFRRTAENFKRQIMEMETEVTKEADNMTDAFRVDGDESAATPATDPSDDPLAEGHSEGEGEGEGVGEGADYDDGMYDYMHEDGYHEDGGDDFNPEGEDEGASGGDADVKPGDPAPAPDAPAPDPAPAADAPAPAAPAAETPAEPKE